jgi:hypothetical protein
LTRSYPALNCVLLNTSPSLYPAPQFDDQFYAANLTSDPAREPVAVGYSIPGTIASAAEKTGRDRNEFAVERISAEQYRTLSQFLDP